MDRCRRWAFNILSALSVLALVMSAVLWVRGHWVAHGVAAESVKYEEDRFTRTSASLVFSQGKVDVTWRGITQVIERPGVIRAYQEHSPAGINLQHWSVGADRRLKENPADSAWGQRLARRGLALYQTSSHQSGVGWYERRLVLPAWMVVVAAAVIPSIWMAALWRRRRYRGRVARGLCGRCGYDLRASPERCPECGQERVAGDVAMR